MSSYLGGNAPASEAQKKRVVLASARRVRQLYRKADTSGEILERWLDRQIDRRTRIMPAQVQRGVTLFQDYFAKVRSAESAMTDLVYTSANL